MYSIECNKDMNNSSGVASFLVRETLTIEQLVRWQAQVLMLMNKNASHSVQLEGSVPDPDPEKGLEPIPVLSAYTRALNRKIYVVYNREGCIGRTAFLRALRRHNGEQFLVFEGVPSLGDFASDVRGAKQRGWIGHSLIFDIYRQFKSRDIYRTIEAASDDMTCSNVWIFTYRMLDISQITEERWEIYTVKANVKEGLMSNLIPLTSEEAKKIYQQEEVDDTAPRDSN